MTVDEICLSIRSDHRNRVFAMEMRKSQTNQLGGHIRAGLGWSLNKPDQERAAIEARANAAIKAGEDFVTATKRAKAKAAKKGIDAEFVPWPTDTTFQRFEAVIIATLTARDAFDSIEETMLKQMKASVKLLPIWDGWARDITGIGEASIATVIGEAGNLDGYDDRAKLWKRMGVAVIDGRRQGNPGADASKKDWILHGYSKKRRSILWVVGDVLVKQSKGPYRKIYEDRKAYEIEQAGERGQTVEPASARTKKFPEKYIAVMAIHRRAQRYTEKQFLRDLLREWKAASRADHVLPRKKAAAALPSDAAREAA